MKQYLLGIFALILAVGFSAFSKPASKKTAQTLYYFEADGNESNCANVSLIFPSSVPPTTLTNCGGNTNYCWIGFPGYKQTSPGVYEPSTSPNGGTVITNYCTSDFSLKQ